jgi:hypothetical protein
MRPPRTPWVDGFPDVVIHSDETARDAHPAYRAAKAGDAMAATRLAVDLLSADAVTLLARLLQGGRPILLPVSAVESLGFNAIPIAMAAELSHRLGFEREVDAVVQSNIVSHSRATGFHRLANPATFAGSVQQGYSYVIVDDHVGLGGTVASLKGHIETNGGRVLAATALSDSQGSRRLVPGPATLAALRGKHGQDLEDFWKSRFGHGIDCLTEPEARYLLRTPTLVRIRNQLAKRAEPQGQRTAREDQAATEGPRAAVER